MQKEAFQGVKGLILAKFQSKMKLHPSPFPVALLFIIPFLFTPRGKQGASKGVVVFVRVEILKKVQSKMETRRYPFQAVTWVVKESISEKRDAYIHTPIPFSVAFLFIMWKLKTKLFLISSHPPFIVRKVKIQSHPISSRVPFHPEGYHVEHILSF